MTSDFPKTGSFWHLTTNKCGTWWPAYAFTLSLTQAFLCVPHIICAELTLKTRIDIHLHKVFNTLRSRWLMDQNLQLIHHRMWAWTLEWLAALSIRGEMKTLTCTLLWQRGSAAFISQPSKPSLQHSCKVVIIIDRWFNSLKTRTDVIHLRFLIH